MIKRGFTLIELLVVITILAILAGAALPYVQSYVAESRIAKAKTDLEEIARALAVYETREGDYNKSTVEDLTGRYLNKAPIDPWGKPYLIATPTGLVISGGPDRDNSTSEDNIAAPYQPPLALVQIKWVDKNQTGAVDTKNVADEVHLYFSRQLLNYAPNLAAIPIDNGLQADPGDSGDTTAAGDVDTMFTLSTAEAMQDQFDVANAKILTNGKVLVLPVQDIAGPGITFTPGSDTISITDNAAPGPYLYDLAGNKCLTDQAVLILPQ